MLFHSLFDDESSQCTGLMYGILRISILFCTHRRRSCTVQYQVPDISALVQYYGALLQQLLWVRLL